MDKKICLDTDVCIAILKGEPRASVVKEKLEGKEVFISAVTMFELLLRKTNLDVVENFMSHAHHLPVDDAVVKVASSLHKNLAKSGKTIDLRDLFIAATCITNELELLTFNHSHFNRIKEIKLFYW